MRGQTSPWLLLAPAVVFGVLLHRHDRVLRKRTARAARHRLLRAGDRTHRGPLDRHRRAGERFRDDITCTPTTWICSAAARFSSCCRWRQRLPGRKRSPRWLKAPAPADEIRARQAAVTELTGALDFSESLGRAALDVRTDVHTEPLLTWASSRRQLSPPWLAWVAGLFTAAVVGDHRLHRQSRRFDAAARCAGRPVAVHVAAAAAHRAGAAPGRRRHARPRHAGAPAVTHRSGIVRGAAAARPAAAACSVRRVRLRWIQPPAGPAPHQRASAAPFGVCTGSSRSTSGSTTTRSWCCRCRSSSARTSRGPSSHGAPGMAPPSANG